VRSLALVALLCARLAAAADDAPVAPPGYTLVPDAQRIEEGRAMLACAVEASRLQTAVVEQHKDTVAVPLVVALVVVSALAGGAIGLGVGLAFRR